MAKKLNAALIPGASPIAEQPSPVAQWVLVLPTPLNAGDGDTAARRVGEVGRGVFLPSGRFLDPKDLSSFV